jgi:hypothetical protein
MVAQEKDPHKWQKSMKKTQKIPLFGDLLGPFRFGQTKWKIAIVQNNFHSNSI